MKKELTLSQMAKKPISNGKIWLNGKEFSQYLWMIAPLSLIHLLPLTILEIRKAKISEKKKNLMILKFSKMRHEVAKQMLKCERGGKGITFRGIEVVRGRS